MRQSSDLAVLSTCLSLAPSERPDATDWPVAVRTSGMGTRRRDRCCAGVTSGGFRSAACAISRASTLAESGHSKLLLSARWFKTSSTRYLIAKAVTNGLEPERPHRASRSALAGGALPGQCDLVRTITCPGASVHAAVSRRRPVDSASAILPIRTSSASLHARHPGDAGRGSGADRGARVRERVVWGARRPAASGAAATPSATRPHGPCRRSRGRPRRSP